ncbi:MAG TPA: protease modulator HflC [Burkholderiales bacterium]|nr:protease modulator HflC [Burkholderiales bacterium]
MDAASALIANPARRWQAVAATIAVMAIAVWAALSSLFVVDVTQYALVTRFGAVLRVLDEPGLQVKAPFDSIVTLDKSLTFSRPAPAEYLSVDKKNIVAETLVTWRIADPQRYLVTVATRAAADVRLADVLLGEVGAVLGAHPAAALIAPDGNAERFGSIVAQIRGRVAAFARSAYGIEIVDVELVRLSLPEQNRAPVFERMKAERGKMAKEYRTAGELLGRKIIAQADREKAHIEAEAYAEAQRIRAEGDAEATRLYSAAFSRNAGFYKFVRTLQTYEKIMDENTTLFLPAQSEVLRVIAPLPRQGSSTPAQPMESTTASGKGPLRSPGADPTPVAGAPSTRRALQ